MREAADYRAAPSSAAGGHDINTLGGHPIVFVDRVSAPMPAAAMVPVVTPAETPHAALSDAATMQHQSDPAWPVVSLISDVGSILQEEPLWQRRVLLQMRAEPLRDLAVLSSSDCLLTIMAMIRFLRRLYIEDRMLTLATPQGADLMYLPPNLHGDLLQQIKEWWESTSLTRRMLFGAYVDQKDIRSARHNDDGEFNRWKQKIFGHKVYFHFFIAFGELPNVMFKMFAEASKSRRYKCREHEGYLASSQVRESLDLSRLEGRSRRRYQCEPIPADLGETPYLMRQYARIADYRWKAEEAHLGFHLAQGGTVTDDQFHNVTRLRAAADAIWIYAYIRSEETGFEYWNRSGHKVAGKKLTIITEVIDKYFRSVFGSRYAVVS